MYLKMININDGIKNVNRENFKNKIMIKDRKKNNVWQKREINAPAYLSSIY